MCETASCIGVTGGCRPVSQELLEGVVGKMGVGFCKLGDFCSVIHTFVRHLERTSASVGVCFDIDDTSNLGQIASDRGGTSTSVHVRHFEIHQRPSNALRRFCSLFVHHIARVGVRHCRLTAACEANRANETKTQLTIHDFSPRKNTEDTCCSESYRLPKIGETLERQPRTPCRSCNQKRPTCARYLSSEDPPSPNSI